MNNDRHSSAWEIIRRLFILSWSYKTGCIKSLILQVFILLLTLSGLSLTGLGIDFVNSRLSSSGKPPSWPLGLEPPREMNALSVVLVISAVIFLCALLRAILNYLYTINLVKFLQQGVVVDLRAKVYNKIQRLSFRFFDSSTSGSLINRVTGDVQMTRFFIDGVIIQGLIMTISLVLYLVYMFFIDIRLTLVCLIPFPLMLVLSFNFSRRLRPEYSRNREMMDGLILGICETVQGMHVIKGFCIEEEKRKEFLLNNQALVKQKFGIYKMSSTFGPSIEFLNQLCTAILLLYGGYSVVKGTLPLGAGLVVFLGLLNKFSAQINSIAGLVDNIQQSITSAERVFEILDMPEEIKCSDKPVEMPEEISTIEFEDVSFSYSNADKVLDKVSFTVKSGMKIGILGSTGSGKSTLLSLIPRFYDPSSGIIRIGGVDIRNYRLDDIRHLSGLVFQESFLFSNTVASNIAFGYPEASMAQIEKAARMASIHDFIVSLPEKYHTVIGEAGADLSGGQRQRLAIARAILLEPKILLLDDPTASVDPDTESEILEALESASVGRTTFFVTHRISVLKKTDMILVLHGGRIVQMGTHDELISSKGQYRRTANIMLDGEGVVKK